jgi:hypothetical protein
MIDFEYLQLLNDFKFVINTGEDAWMIIVDGELERGLAPGLVLGLAVQLG